MAEKRLQNLVPMDVIESHCHSSVGQSVPGARSQVLQELI